MTKAELPVVGRRLAIVVRRMLLVARRSPLVALDLSRSLDARKRSADSFAYEPAMLTLRDRLLYDNKEHRCLGTQNSGIKTPPGGGGSNFVCLYISDGLVWSVPCLAHMTIECRVCPGSGRVGAWRLESKPALDCARVETLARPPDQAIGRN